MDVVADATNAPMEASLRRLVVHELHGHGWVQGPAVATSTLELHGPRALLAHRNVLPA